MADEERKVLVGRTYESLSNDWQEPKDKTFEEACQEIEEKAKGYSSEIIEVIVVRRAVVNVSVKEVSL